MTEMYPESELDWTESVSVCIDCKRVRAWGTRCKCRLEAKLKTEAEPNAVCLNCKHPRRKHGHHEFDHEARGDRPAFRHIVEPCVECMAINQPGNICMEFKDLEVQSPEKKEKSS